MVPLTKLMRRTRLAGIVAAVALSVAACGGAGDGNGTGAAGDSAGGTPATLLEPDAFAERIAAHPQAMLINVHVPYEGEIEGTEAHIPFDRIAGDPRLPADKDSEIILYCRSGRMSVTAAQTLAAEGYSKLYDLKGGMIAWESAGKPLVHTPEQGGQEPSDYSSMSRARPQPGG